MDIAAMERAWNIGTRYASIQGTRNVTPWEALLGAVSQSAYRVEWLDVQVDTITEQLQQIQNDETVVLPEGVTLQEVLRVLEDDRHRWVVESRNERTLLAKLSDSAIRAGLAERIVMDVEEQSRVIARVVSAALGAAELDDSQRRKALAAMDSELRHVAEDMRKHALGS